MRNCFLVTAALAAILLAAVSERFGSPSAHATHTYAWPPIASQDVTYGYLDDPRLRSSPFVNEPPPTIQHGGLAVSHTPWGPGNDDQRIAAVLPAPDDPGPPGWTTRITNLARGRLQLEGGYAYLADRVDGISTRQHAAPDLLLRIGLTDRLEARIGWPGYVETQYRVDSVRLSDSEMLDPNAGFMLDLWPQRGWLPQTAAAASVPITLSGNPFALEGLQPVAQVLYAWGLSERLTFGGNTGYTLFRHPDDHYSQFQQSLSVDYLLSDRLTSLVQWEMLSNHGSANDGVEHMLGVGAWWAVTPRWSLGGRTAVGLNARAPDFLATVRFAVRY